MSRFHLKLISLLIAAIASYSTWSTAAEPLTPDEALVKLKQGHERFVLDQPNPHVLGMKERVKLAMEQHPFAIVLTCADSRVAPELIFDQGLGDLFVLRVAGNITESGVVGSIEYAAEHLHCPLVVVLGHENCGAVKAAMHLEEVRGNLGVLVGQVRLSSRTNDSASDLQSSIRSNVNYHAEDLKHKSSFLRELIQSGKLRVEAATYSLSTGRVEWLGKP